MRVRFSASMPPDDEFLPKDWEKTLSPADAELRENPVSFAKLYAKWIKALRSVLDADVTAAPFTEKDCGVLIREEAFAYCLAFFYRLFVRSPLLGDPSITASSEEDAVLVRISAEAKDALLYSEESLLSTDAGALSRMSSCAERGNFRFFFDRTRDRFDLVVSVATVRTEALALSERVAAAIERAVRLAFREADSVFKQ
jgi:hypothetical protein